MLTSAELTSRLREAGFKVTPQRLAVYNMLSHTKAHPNADTIYKELQPLYPTMSLATVYKALAILCDLGLAQALHVGAEAGRVDDVPALNTEGVYEQVKDETGYVLSDHQLYFFGVCPECQEKKAHAVH